MRIGSQTAPRRGGRRHRPFHINGIFVGLSTSLTGFAEKFICETFVAALGGNLAARAKESRNDNDLQIEKGEEGAIGIGPTVNK